MDLSRIKQLLQLVAESDVNEIEIEEGDFKLIIRKNAPSMIMQQAPYMPPMMPYYPQAGVIPNPAEGLAPQAPVFAQPAAVAPQAASEPEPAKNEHIVRAPIVGTFYTAPSPDSPIFVSVGDSVAAGSVLCIIEAMKLMNEIECDVAGKITKILVENEQPVEYDQPLFVVELS